MSSKFSGVLQLTDLDDFITPSQECIKPIEVKKPRIGTGARVKIHSSDGYNDPDTAGVKKLEKVQITLNDCLACSGCITSAEGVLINQQNFDEIIKTLNQNKVDRENGCGKYVVISLAIQPVLSIARKYDLTPEAAAKCLVTFFKDLGADLVVEISVAEDLALIEVQNEFLERYQSKGSGKSALPMLASSCPGWVCYAEKTHGSFILPYISTTKSPQQIMGSLVKYNLGRSPSDVYHVTLMPCYDKKLEASRNEFFNSELNAKDVDCVITTIELEQLLMERQVSLTDLKQTELDYPWGRDSNSALFGHAGSGSGGYAHHILVKAAREVLGVGMMDVKWQMGKNPDLREVSVEGVNGAVLRFAIANGFRNIQNVVQRLKRGKSAYDYVEIMACPSGCVNGGAQIKAKDASAASAREIISRLEELYAALPVISPEDSAPARRLYTEWLDGPGSDKCSAMLHTSYRAIEKSTLALNIKW